MSKINIIDPGHDNTLDPGALGKLYRLGAERLITEAGLNMPVANRVIALTENYQQCFLTRRWDTPGPVSLASRVEIANNQLWSKGGGYSREEVRLISIHHNSYNKPEVNGLEVYYKEGCWQSKELADRMRENIISSYQSAGYAIQDRGTKTAPFYVLRNSFIPAVLVELGFMSNPVELDFISSPAGCVAGGYGIALTLLEFE